MVAVAFPSKGVRLTNFESNFRSICECGHFLFLFFVTKLKLSRKERKKHSQERKGKRERTRTNKNEKFRVHDRSSLKKVPAGLAVPFLKKGDFEKKYFFSFLCLLPCFHFAKKKSFSLTGTLPSTKGESDTSAIFARFSRSFSNLFS